MGGLIRESRFIPYKRRSCFENMAIDEYLLDYYNKTRKPVLRLYGWRSPSITLGRYQKTESINIRRCHEDNVGIVRRITGGGAIFHDNELTYSFACSANDIGSRHYTVKESFEKLNLFIIEMYKRFGLSAAYAKDLYGDKRLGETAPFCFSNNEAYDIIVNGKKIGGNAQRRWKNVIFQHGSIPFDINKDKIKRYVIPGVNFKNFASLNALLKRAVNIDEVAENLKDCLSNLFKVVLKTEDISDSEREHITHLIRKKYYTNQWNLEGRTDGHTAQTEEAVLD